MDKKEIRVNPGARTLRVDGRDTLLTGLSLHGFFRNLPLCAGIGRCGNCRLRFISNTPAATSRDRESLEPADIDRGFRLACEHRPRTGQEIEIPSRPPVRVFSPVTSGRPESLVVDIGTTTVKWAYDFGAGEVDLGSAPNPQSGTGGEVMSRMQFALQGPERAEAQQEALLCLVQEILDLATCLPRVTVFTGNPAMLCLALGYDCSPLARSPYSLPFSGDFWFSPKPGLPEVYIPPLVSPFIGADIVCGLLETGLCDQKGPWLFADFGTNAEMVLGTEKGCFGTSVAMGPALEGCGLRFGAPAGQKGVCTKIALSSRGIYPQGTGKCTHLSATAYLDLVRRLKGLGVIRSDGRFSEGLGSPLANRVRSQIRKRRLYLNEAIYLDPADIEELLKVKAAFSLGLDSLLKTAGIPAAGLEKVCIAGALGERLSPAVLTGLGFLPPASEEKINFCGNTSLSGGLKLAADLDRGRLEAHKIRGRVQTVDLTQTRFYTGKEFARHMRFESV